MNIPKNIKDLEGVTVVKVTKEAWGPSGTLGLAKPGVAAGIASFQLTIPTSANDIWDYIWRSEKEKQSTEKVQLFQEGQRIPGSRVTGIAREGADERWDASGRNSIGSRSRCRWKHYSPMLQYKSDFFGTES